MADPARWGEVKFPALYYIHTFTGVGKEERNSLYRICLDVIQGGCRLIQLRFKGTFGPTVADILRLMILDFEGSDARFLLNDRAEWASQVGAHGVHVGESGDTTPADARAMLGGSALIGATTKTPEQLSSALAAGVDYISWGALYASTTKPDAVPGALSEVGRLKAQLPQGMRLCVIGGITGERIPAIMKEPGIDLIAIGSAIQRSPDPELATIKLVDAIRLASGN